MKTEELKAQGLTQEQINFVMAENGKDIDKIQKKLDDMTAERDKEKGRADTAEETLKGFDGVDVEKLNKSIADWKKKAEDAEKDYKQKIADRDFDDLLKEAIKSANGLNEKAIMGCLDIPTLKASKNQKSDIESAIKALSEAEDSKMLFKAENSVTPHFTSVNKGGNNGGGIKSKEDIYATDPKTGKFIYGTAERQKLIAENPQLFQ
nr:MAG TPA_asm: minor structural protein [Caudoviricetes sp.]